MCLYVCVSVIAAQFGQSSDVSEWVNLVILVFWVIWLRAAHFCMIYRGILPYRNAMAVPPAGAGGERWRYSP